MISLFQYLKPYKGLIFLIIVLTLSASVLELLLPTLMADVVDIGIVNGDMPFIVRTGIWMVVCSLAAVILTIVVTYLSNRVAMGFSRDVRQTLFYKVEGFSLQQFEKIGPASLITRTTNDIKQVQDAVNMMLRIMTRAPLMLVGGIILAVSREPALSVVFLAVLPILVGTIWLIARKAIPLFGLLQKKTDRLNLLLREVLSGIRVVRAFNRVEYERNRFNQANEEYRDTGIKVNQIIAVVFPFMLITMNFTNVAIIWFGAIQIDAGAMQVGNLMAFLQYAMMILMSLIMLSFALIMIPRAQASANRINEVLLADLINGEERNVQPVSVQSRSDNVVFKGNIEFQNVTFRFEGAEKPALRNITFTIKAGQTIGIIGSTGAGKSALVQLIPRFYNVESGKILIDGINVQDIDEAHLRGQIGYVPQRPSIFSGTIADNIRFGKEDATDEEVLEAIETAQGADFVKDKEEGINHRITQGGTNLSGGQKQRLSIARALVRKPPIYIFDDCFSALDYKTDANLRKELKGATKDTTKILVAQRVSTVMDADQIFVLNEGALVAAGTHENLLENSEIYQEIVSSQYEKGETA